jgi:hypothetical protein
MDQQSKGPTFLAVADRWIALKRKFLAVELTVSLVHLDKKSRDFRRLAVPETIEWE